MDHTDSYEERIVEERPEPLEDQTLVLTEPRPEEPLVLPHQREEGQSLVQTIIMVIGGVILVILLVLFARWVYHSVHHSAEPNTSGTLQLPQESYNQGNQQGATSQPSSQSQNNSANSPSNQTSYPSNSSAGKALPNNGPGGVAAIFAGSTVAAAGLHYIISLRRFNKFTQ